MSQRKNAVKTSDIHRDQTQKSEHSFRASITGIISVKGLRFPLTLCSGTGSVFEDYYTRNWDAEIQNWCLICSETTNAEPDIIGFEPKHGLM